MWLLGWQLNAQNCDVIRQKIKIAINKSLDEALVEVKALRACDNSAAGKQEADDWTERIFKILKERQTQAKAAEIRAKAEAEQAQRDAEVAETARKQAEIERNNALAAQQLALEKTKERVLLDEEKALILGKKAFQIRVSDLMLLGNRKMEEKEYATAIDYFNKAMILAQTNKPFLDAFTSDSIKLLENIKISNKLYSLSTAIQKLYANADTAALLGRADFANTFQQLRTAAATPLILPDRTFFIKDSLLIIEKLKAFEASLIHKLRVQRNTTSYYYMMAAAAEISDFFNQPVLEKKRMNMILRHRPPSSNYTDYPYLQEQLSRQESRVLRRKFEVGFGIRSHFGLLLDKNYGETSNGKKITAEFPIIMGADYEQYLVFHLNKKSSLQLSVLGAITSFTSDIKFNYNDNNNFELKAYSYYLTTVGFLYRNKILNFKSNKSNNWIDIDLCGGLSISSSPYAYVNYFLNTAPQPGFKEHSYGVNYKIEPSRMYTTNDPTTLNSFERGYNEWLGQRLLQNVNIGGDSYTYFYDGYDLLLGWFLGVYDSKKVNIVNLNLGCNLSFKIPYLNNFTLNVRPSFEFPLLMVGNSFQNVYDGVVKSRAIPADYLDTYIRHLGYLNNTDFYVNNRKIIQNIHSGLSASFSISYRF